MALPPAEPAELEAVGQESVTATFSGREWRLSAADDWPLDLILACPTQNQHGALTINYPALFAALELIVGEEQWPALIEACPKRRDLVAAAQAFAAAAGFPKLIDGDRAFGALPTTLALLTKYPGKVESDLDRFWGIDYRDRWRRDSAGHRALTLRQIHVRLSNLPGESALAITLGRRTGAELLLMDVYKAIAGQDHPARPMTPEEAAQARAEQAALSKARADSRARANRVKNQRLGAAELARRNAAERKQREGQHAEAS